MVVALAALLESDRLVGAIVGGAVTLAGMWVGLKGVRLTASVSREAADQSSAITAQDSALQTLREFIDPLRDEVRDLRARDVEKGKQIEEMVGKQGCLTQQLADLRGQLNEAIIEMKHWRKMARVIARWATTLRDQVIALGGQAPASPKELLILQDVDDGFFDDDPADA